MFGVADLRTPGRIGGVGSVGGDFVEHRVEEHVDPGIGLDEVRELLQDRVQGFPVARGVDFGDYAAEPGVVGALSGGHPFAEAEELSD